MPSIPLESISLCRYIYFLQEYKMYMYMYQSSAKNMYICMYMYLSAKNMYICMYMYESSAKNMYIYMYMYQSSAKNMYICMYMYRSSAEDVYCVNSLNSTFCGAISANKGMLKFTELEVSQQNNSGFVNSYNKFPNFSDFIGSCCRSG